MNENRVVEVTNCLTRRTIIDMSKEDFLDMPYVAWDANIGLFDSLIVVPTGEMHESGFMTMSYVAVNGLVPIARLGGGDTLHFGGIAAVLRPPASWICDCLPSGLLRFFDLERGQDSCRPSLSSFEVFCERQKS